MTVGIQGACQSTEVAATGAVSQSAAPADLSHVKTVNEFVAAMRAWRGKSVEAIIQQARLCAYACSTLTKSQRREFQTKARLSAPSFSRFAKIGSRPWLTDPCNWRLLPASEGTLYELAHLTESEFQAKRDDIRPDLEREEAVNLRESKPRRMKSTSKTVLATVYSDGKNVVPADLKALQAAIKSLSGCSSLSVRPSPAYERVTKTN